MSDVSKFGPLGAGEETRPLKVDLTRIDIRRGTLNLPRRFYDAFPAGEIEANDVALGRKLTVTFVPPRELEGLGPFFEEHELQPNDAVTIALAGGLHLTPIKRERRQERENGGESRSALHSGSSAADATDVVPVRHEAEGYVRERVRLEARPLGREAPGEEEPQEHERTRVRLKAQEPSAYLAPPVPEMKGGWQDVLHDPVPRKDQMLRPSERAVTGPGEPAADAAQRHQGQRSEGRQQGLFANEPEQFGTVREAPRQEARSRAGRSDNLPLAPRQEAEREQPRDRNAASGAGSGAGTRDRPEAQARPASPPQERIAQPEPELEAEREPVLVGGSQAEGDVTGAISNYLRDPSTPAIVRAAAVAEELRLPLDAVQKGLAEVSRNSDGSVAPIRQDVYLVKRSR